MKEIKLTQGQVALVDDIDFEYLAQWNWQATCKDTIWYASRADYSKGRPYKVIYMHREILDPPDEKKVDHKDRNGLNNQKYNLRVCTTSQNGMNRKKNINNNIYKGISYAFRHNKWQATIKIQGHNFWLGYFDTEVEAHHEYCQAAEFLFGEFARFK